ncbi:MAG: hypothetical protein ACYC27_13045 [Armatimonadota bacterium]
MRRYSIYRNVCLFALLTVLAVVFTGCSKPITPNAPVNSAQYEADADRRWPKSKVLLGYSSALEEYDSGNVEGGIKQVEELVDKPLRIAPDSVIGDNNLYFDVYMMGRVFPVIENMYDIISKNVEYTSKLVESDKHQEALSILALNLDISRQMIHIKPMEITTIIRGNSEWKITWEQISKVLQKKGDTEGAKLALEQNAIAYRFSSQKIRNMMNKYNQETDPILKKRNWSVKDISSPGKLSTIRVNHQADLRKLVKDWDKEADTPEARKLIGRILAN